MDDRGGRCAAGHAGSVFEIPLTTTYGWTVSQVTLVVKLAIFSLGIAAFFGDWRMKRKGPRVAAPWYGGEWWSPVAGGSVILFALSYGVLSGVDLGLGYIVPMSTRSLFPNRRA